MSGHSVEALRNSGFKRLKKWVIKVDNLARSINLAAVGEGHLDTVLGNWLLTIFKSSLQCVWGWEHIVV